MTIEIVSDPEIMHGRWCFAGTRMPAGMVKHMAFLPTGTRWVIDNYQHIPLTQAHIDAALAFGYPPIRNEPEIEELHEIDCVCGESADQAGVNPLSYRCEACGKRWQVTISEVKP